MDRRALSVSPQAKDIRRGQWQLRCWQEIPDPQLGQQTAGTLPGNDSSSAQLDAQKMERPRNCGAMTQQCGDSGSRSTTTRRRNSCVWWGAATPVRGPKYGFVAPYSRQARKSRRVLFRRCYWMNSPHFCTAASAAPQGMIGTEEVEFLATRRSACPITPCKPARSAWRRSRGRFASS